MSTPLRKSEHESHLAQRRANLRDERRFELVKAMVSGGARGVLDTEGVTLHAPYVSTLLDVADTIIDALEARRNEEANGA